MPNFSRRERFIDEFYSWYLTNENTILVQSTGAGWFEKWACKGLVAGSVVL
ncbi:hypothetical protein SAMN05216327_112172 [Dyadobacter sp. SG02]|nr:hypothetical protein SAMN05216327_112172 [Dyadobacter sp. SG02]